MKRHNYCKSCKFWSRLTEYYGKCHQKAPLVNGEYAGIFPKTMENDTCNRFVYKYADIKDNS